MDYAYAHICRVGQSHIHAVYKRYFWQGYHQIYGHIQCIYTVLDSPTHVAKVEHSYEGAVVCREGFFTLLTAVNKQVTGRSFSIHFTSNQFSMQMC